MPLRWQDALKRPDSNFKQRADMRSRSRGGTRPGFASASPSLQNRGRRESRMPIAPAVVRTKSARVDHRFNRIAPAFPARMGYGLLRALPGDRAFLPPSPCGLTTHLKPGWAGCIFARLDASIGAPGPHDFAVRARPAKALAGPRATRRVLAKTVLSAGRPRAGPPLTGKTRPAIPLRARRCRVHRIPPRVRDDHDTPLVRVRRGELVKVICPTG
jgi:hypothetical protein